ncbi:PREDICTED: uncharacterized protein LOC108692538 [Atta colombica]|nr:PREDICTED: uncharacterized protein LOC108692538 [Atta colombica]
MEVRRRRARPQDSKHDADATDQSRTVQRDEANGQTNSNTTLIESNKANSSYSIESKQPLSSNVVHARIRISLEIDLIAVILLISGICTRLYCLEEPRSIV